MGITMMTALEIFTNPDDLEIIIGTDGGKWGFAITRGPKYNHKVMLDMSGFAETEDVSIKAVKDVLESIREALTKDFANHKNLPSQYLNPDGLEIDQSKVLNPDLIIRILDELRQHKVARTYKMRVEMPTS